MIVVVVNLLRPAAALPIALHSMTQDFDVVKVAITNDKPASTNSIPAPPGRELAARVVYPPILKEKEVWPAISRGLAPYNIAIRIIAVIAPVLH